MLVIERESLNGAGGMLLQTRNTNLAIRDASDDDIGAIASIYGHHVETSCASFEETPPSVTEMRNRFTEIKQRGLPYLVADTGGQVAGFAFAGVYKDRSAYRYTVEDSIYVSPDLCHRGMGSQLLEALIDACTSLGHRQMMAVIGDSGNTASIALHSKLGFRTIGTAANVGFKFGRWVDIVYMQRTLGQTDISLLKTYEGNEMNSHSRWLSKSYRNDI